MGDKAWKKKERLLACLLFGLMNISSNSRPEGSAISPIQLNHDVIDAVVSIALKRYLGPHSEFEFGTIFPDYYLFF
jgi:hypothetical protein